MIEKNERIIQTISNVLNIIFEKYYLKANTIKTLSDCSEEIICGKTPSTKVESNWNGEIPFITIPDMHNSIYVTSYERFLSSKGATSQSNKFLPKNSICVSCIATPGLVSLTSEISQTNQQINSIICKKNISPFYLYLLLNTKDIKQLIINLGSGGSTTYNLNKNSFSNIEVKLLSPEDMLEFDIEVKSFFDLIIEYNDKIKKIKVLKQHYLKKFFG